MGQCKDQVGGKIGSPTMRPVPSLDVWYNLAGKLSPPAALQSLVAEMAMRYRECFGEVFRFQVINGTLWVDHISERHTGWYPSQDGEGDIPL